MSAFNVRIAAQPSFVRKELKTGKAVDNACALCYTFFMRIEQSVEDYLETIHIISQTEPQVHQVDVARRLGVSQPAVTKAIRKLKDLGYVVTEGMHIFLTDSGRARAESVYEKHIAVRRFLVVLGVSGEAAERDACLIEHIISDETYAAIKSYLANNADK